MYSVHEDGFVHEDRYISSGIIPTLAQSLSKGEHLEWVSKLKEVLVEDNDRNLVSRDVSWIP